jgi:murein DD-endopeptidase MepM/ murein hydrolase activator NlpD
MPVPHQRVSVRALVLRAGMSLVCLIAMVTAGEHPSVWAGQGRFGFEVCPVDSPRRYMDDFGTPRYSGGYHPHQGIDIFARYGTPVRAPFNGRIRVSRNWAGGLAVEVHGKAGFVYNGHLSKLGNGGRVRAGDVIGYVGNSGNASGGSPHDHFEWHPGGPDAPAVNPYRLLRAACRSRDRHPPRALQSMMIL